MSEKEASGQGNRDWQLSPDQITAYHQACARESTAPAYVDEQTWSDLEMDRIFARFDRCVSPPGAQYLYALMRAYPRESRGAEETARLILAFKNNPEMAAALRTALKPLNRDESKGLADFLFGPAPTVPAGYWFFYVLSALSVACTIGLLVSWLFAPPLLGAVFLLAGVLWITNGLLHRHAGHKVIGHSGALTSLAVLLGCVPKTAAAILNLDAPESREIESCVPIARKNQKNISWAFLRKYGTDDFTLILLDYLNVFCLFELSALCQSIRSINRDRAALVEIFELVARLDAVQGLAATFSEYPSACVPEIKPGREFALEGVYHPLLENPVANSVAGSGCSILLTGTNMAGKTTFIKSLAINLLFSQTLGLCLAHKALLPPARVCTLIERADVTTSRHSYFYYEAVELLRMLEDSKKSGREHWFVLDEIFRGTNALERVAAGCAVLRHLDRHGVVVASTHDHELTILLQSNFDQYHFSEVIVGNEARFDYLLHQGPCQTRNAIKLLGLAGYPKEVTDLAGKLTETNNVERRDATETN